MKTIASIIIVASILLFGSIYAGVAQSQPAAAKHEPNSGYVTDATAAKDIAKVVLSRLLTADDFQRKQFSDAVLKDGIWTVRYWEPKTRINFPVVIQIRQQTGGIISYADPNA